MTSLPADRKFLVLALFVGLLVRIAALLQTGALGPQIVDEQHYIRLATSLSAGHGFGWGPGDLTSIRPPLYPALISGLWTVTGVGNFQAVRVVQMLLALLNTWLVYQLGRRVFSPTVGRYAAALFWLYPSLVVVNFFLLTETLFTLLLTLFVLLTVMTVDRPRVATALAAGVALGLAALTRSILWPVPLLLCPLLLVLLRTSGARRVLLATAVLFGYAVIVGPWAVRNTRLQHVTTIVDTMGGLNLRMGNYEFTPDDRMWDAVSITGTKSWVYGIDKDFPPGHVPTEGEKDKWAQRKAIEYVRAHPVESFRRSLIKFSDFWGLEREYLAGVEHGLFSPPRWVTMLVGVTSLAAFCVLTLAGAAGLWLAAPNWRAHVLLLLPIVIITGVHSLVFGHSRYHLPLVPLLCLYASALVVGGRRTRWSSSSKYGATLLVGLLILVWARQVVLVDGDRIRHLLSSLL